jgi:hypothetical protein
MGEDSSPIINLSVKPYRSPPTLKSPFKMKGMRLYAQEKGTMAPPPGTLIRAHVHMRDSAVTRIYAKPDHEEKPCKAYDSSKQNNSRGQAAVQWQPKQPSYPYAQQSYGKSG